MGRRDRPEEGHEEKGFLDELRGKRLSRRETFRLAGAASTGLALGTGGMGVAATGSHAEDREPGVETVPFHGLHQSGIVTPSQHRLHFTAFDVTTEDREELRDLLHEWSDAAAAMCGGEPMGDVGGIGHSPYLPPEGTGEATGHSASRLTITFGFGPTLFERNGEDRFGRTSSTSQDQETGRNLFGFKGGTNNLKAEDVGSLNHNVWVGPSDGLAWMEGGTYLVSRRIRMLLEVWDRSSLEDQKKTFGRHKVSGAPIGRSEEFDAVDLEAKSEDGEPLIPTDSHVRLGAEGGESILRRSYSYTNGMDRERDQLDAGLFFVCFQRDPGGNSPPCNGAWPRTTP